MLWYGEVFIKSHRIADGEVLKVQVTEEKFDLNDADWAAYCTELAKESAAYDKQVADNIEAERVKKEAEIAAKALKLKEVQEAAEKADRERQEALRPDKEKMEALALTLEGLSLPEVTSAEFKAILVGTKTSLLALADTIRQSVNKL